MCQIIPTKKAEDERQRAKNTFVPKMRVGEDGQHYSILGFDAMQFRTEYQHLAETCSLHLHSCTLMDTAA
jgi:hypothetical protein